MAEKKEAIKESSKRKEDNTIYVGSKPAMSYVLAVVTQFSDGQNDVHIKARGKAISRAVDVAEIVRNRFASDAKIDNITIGTDEITTEDGEKMNVSSIQIDLKK